MVFRCDEEYAANNMKSVGLKFTGKHLDHSVDAFDLAKTIIAFGHVLEGIAQENYLSKDEQLRLNVTAFKHNCFLTQFDMSLVDTAGVVVTATKAVLESGMLDKLELTVNTFKDLARLLIFLKGKQPEKVAIDKSQRVDVGTNYGSVTVYQFGENTTVSLPAYRSFQSKTTMGNMRKMKEALETNPEIEEYEFLDGDKPILELPKKQATYFDLDDKLQVTENHRVKGVVSKLDTATENGYLSLESKNRRVAFSFSKMEDGIEGDNYFKIVDSLKFRIPIFLVGTAEFNLESELQRIEVQKIESDLQLFPPQDREKNQE